MQLSIRFIEESIISRDQFKNYSKGNLRFWAILFPIIIDLEKQFDNYIFDGFKTQSFFVQFRDEFIFSFKNRKKATFLNDFRFINFFDF